MTRATFTIHYATHWGENLFLALRLAAPDPGAMRTISLPMHHVGDGCWQLTLELDEAGGQIEYRYILRGATGVCRPEPAFRQVRLAGNSLGIFDQWLAADLPDASFLRQAFAGIIFRPDPAPVADSARDGAGVLRFTLRAPRVQRGYRVCLSGNHPLLGGWDPGRARIMSGARYPLWETELPLAELTPPLEYKFGLWSDQAGRLDSFETGPNRWFTKLPLTQDSGVINGEHFRHDSVWKGAGVAIPVFSLRSEQGYGIGEFADLEPFAAWAAGCGLHLVQVLPVNDTTTDFTWKDSYPYKAISTAALHPIYVNVQALYDAYQLPLPVGYGAQREALNRLPQLDYELVLKDKLAFLRQLYAAVGVKMLAGAEFQTFWQQQADWLKPYAAFCRLRDLRGTADFTQWGEHAVYRESRIHPWFASGAAEYNEVMFHCFVQYHLWRQFAHALAAGHAHGVAFKGDLPIGVDRCSVEAWTGPELLHMDRQTGAPPDTFSALGQNWGFPTYNWPRMEADGYAWWRRRFARMSASFDALRIDHILGFFRIWEIPREYSEGIMGHFNPALPLSRDEIKRFGFGRAPELFTAPSVAAAGLEPLFGSAARKVASALLFRDHDGFFRLRPEFAQPEARRTWYAHHCTKTEAARIDEAIRRLSYEVLFLADPDQPACFHPRIALADTALFRSLEPPEQTAMRQLHDDFFYRRHTRFWESEAMKKLPALLDATRMLICGEDLGMIPDAVPVVLQRLGLLSLEVQAMPKQPGQKFGRPQDYPYLSVCATSTHDMPTMRGLWEENEPTRRAFWEEVMRRPSDPPADATPEICRFILQLNLDGASMWCIPPLQDWLALDPRLRHPAAAAERINVPVIPRHYWRYRLHLTIEELRRATDFNRMILDLVEGAGRRPAR